MPAEPGAGDEPDAFLLGGQHDVMDVGILDAQLDQAAVAGIGHIADLADADPAELRIDRVRPAERRCVVVHGALVSCASLRK